ncbi:MAG TPA: SDR family oxidoreductase [Bryobacteraceae bacterium]|nr:SDR family oxidoreductase [Bryobacteraceae bacterium]
MKIVVLGATGGTGLEIVRQAIEQGHAVTAFVRSPERLRPFRDHINVQQGNLLSGSELEEVLQSQDAVLSAFGPRVPIAKTDENLLREFAAVLTLAMLRAEVQRLIVESSAFLFKDSIIPPTYIAGKLLFPSVVTDASGMEEIIQRSPLDWTLIRPPRLTDGQRSAKYRVREGHLPWFGFSISRADVADCFLRALNEKRWTRKIVGASR